MDLDRILQREDDLDALAADLWPWLCALLQLEVREVPRVRWLDRRLIEVFAPDAVNPAAFIPGEGVYLSYDDPIRLGVLVHELAHAAGASESGAVWVEEQFRMMA